MYCKNCGASMDEKSGICPVCKIQQVRLAGFSTRINDPAFKKYLKNSNQWSVLFSLLLAVIAVVGFFIYGSTSSEMENPQAVLIGAGIGGMFLMIALFQVIGRKTGKTWDGYVENKTVKEKVHKEKYNDGEVRYEKYLEYSVFIRSDQGKSHVISSKNDDTLYNYYKTGDRIRHHAGLNSYEKYDKSGDDFIPCNACGTLCDIKEEICNRCKCPLLK